MTVPLFLVLCGLVLDAIGLLVATWPIWRASDEDLKQQSGGITYDGISPSFRLALFRERKAARVGVALMVVGFILQGLGVWPW